MYVKPHKARTHTNDMYICYGYRAHLSECIIVDVKSYKTVAIHFAG